MPAPALTRRDVDGSPTGLVLMLHGGKADGLDPIDERSASWRRSSWMMGHIGDRLNSAGVARVAAPLPGPWLERPRRLAAVAGHRREVGPRRGTP